MGALVARVVTPEDGAEREIEAELVETRVRIEYLATSRRHQGRGVGTHLVDAAEGWGRDQRATASETTTYARSPVSLPFGRSAWDIGSTP